MRAQWCRDAARLLQAVQAPWCVEAPCCGSCTGSAAATSLRWASHHAAAVPDHIETPGGGGSCWRGPGADAVTASSHSLHTSNRLGWTGPCFHRLGLGSGRGFSSLADRQLELDGDALGGEPPRADREPGTAAPHDAHGAPEPAAGDQHAPTVGGPVAHGAAAVARWLAEEGVLPQEEAERAVDRIVHFYAAYGSVSRLAGSPAPEKPPSTVPAHKARAPLHLAAAVSPCCRQGRAAAPLSCVPPPAAAPTALAAAGVGARGSAGGGGAAPAAWPGPAPLPDPLASHPGWGGSTTAVRGPPA